MFSIEDVNKILQDEYIPVPYILARELGSLNTCVLSLIWSEFRYAHKKGLANLNYYLTDLNRMANSLGITVGELEDALRYLEDCQLIYWYDSCIEDTTVIIVYIYNIVQLKKDLDEQQGLLEWHAGLDNAQNPSLKERKFLDTTNTIINYVEKHFTKDIPMIIYQRCNDYIADYESDGAKLLDDVPDFKDIINKNICFDNYNESLLSIVQDLCRNK